LLLWEAEEVDTQKLVLMAAVVAVMVIPHPQRVKKYKQVSLEILEHMGLEMMGEQVAVPLGRVILAEAEAVLVQ
jgi:hypothetical protein